MADLSNRLIGMTSLVSIKDADTAGGARSVARRNRGWFILEEDSMLRIASAGYRLQSRAAISVNRHSA